MPLGTEYYYSYHPQTKTIYYSIDIPVDRPDLVFLDTSELTNHRMAAAIIAARNLIGTGYELKELHP